MEKFLREPLYATLSIRASLKKIYGVGKTKGRIATVCLGLPSTRSNYSFKQLGRDSVYRIAFFLDAVHWDIGEYLQGVEKEDRTFLRKTYCYRHFRFSMGLPCNGQRTKTNAGSAKRRNAGTKTYSRFQRRQNTLRAKSTVI